MPVQVLSQRRELYASLTPTAALETWVQLLLLLVLRLEVVRIVIMPVLRSKLPVRYIFSDVGFFDLRPSFSDSRAGRFDLSLFSEPANLIPAFLILLLDFLKLLL